MIKGIKIVLTERQEKWLINHFKHTKNAEISAKLNISERSVLRIARHLGLHKSRQFMARCQQEAAAAANRSNRINGTYPPKGYIIPRSEEYRFQPGVSIRQRLGAKRFAEIRKRAAESWKQTFKKEKARATFGLEQHTCLRVIRQPREKVALRHYLKRRGYVVDDDRRIAYYTDSTQRGKRIEAKPQQWYKFCPMPPENIKKNKMDKRKIYISLPITGQEDVAPVVAGYVKECLQKEFPLAEVISPFAVCPGQPVSYAYAMGRDIETLLVCDAVYFVPGWRKSKGCRLERHAALLYNKHIVPSAILPLGELRRYVRKLS